MTFRHIRLVSLWIHPGQEAAFEAFEHDAARLMAKHGGRIEQAVRIGGSGESPYEVHVVSFPDRAAADAYGNDPATLELRRRRDTIIARTEFMEGRDAGPYGA